MSHIEKISEAEDYNDGWPDFNESYSHKDMIHLIQQSKRCEDRHDSIVRVYGQKRRDPTLLTQYIMEEKVSFLASELDGGVLILCADKEIDKQTLHDWMVFGTRLVGPLPWTEYRIFLLEEGLMLAVSIPHLPNHKYRPSGDFATVEASHEMIEAQIKHPKLAPILRKHKDVSPEGALLMEGILRIYRKKYVFTVAGWVAWFPHSNCLPGLVFNYNDVPYHANGVLTSFLTEVSAAMGRPTIMTELVALLLHTILNRDWSIAEPTEIRQERNQIVITWPGWVSPQSNRLLRKLIPLHGEDELSQVRLRLQAEGVHMEMPEQVYANVQIKLMFRYISQEYTPSPAVSPIPETTAIPHRKQHVTSLQSDPAAIPSAPSVLLPITGAELRKWRIGQGLTQSQAAMMLESTQPGLCQNEKRGEKPISARLMETFKRVIGGSQMH